MLLIISHPYDLYYFIIKHNVIFEIKKKIKKLKIHMILIDLKFFIL